MSHALTYVEIDIPWCTLTYGVAPCTASIPTTGPIKCFQTRSTCQDLAHFTPGTVTLRFAMDADYLPKDIPALPMLSQVEISPSEVSLGSNLGVRASISADFIDAPHSDVGPGFDKYVTERPYDPYKRGTLFGKFRARQPYIVGAPLRLIRGFLGQTLEQMETRYFIVDQWDGPTPDAKYKLVGKDPLRLASGKRSQAPIVSDGYLSQSLDAISTSITLLPASVGGTYPASGYVAIGGQEICDFTRSGDVMTIGRGKLNTLATEHNAQDAVQLVLRYVSQDPADIISDLLQNYAGVSASFIPLADWQTETSTALNMLYTGSIAQPTDVEALISELIQQCGLAVWWDDVDQEVKLRVLRGFSPVNRIDEQVILRGTLRTQEQASKRISQVWTWFGQRNPLVPLDDNSNYRAVEALVDTDSEAAYNVSSIEKIHSRWITGVNREAAEMLNQIRLTRFKIPPRKVWFSLHRGSFDVQMGAPYWLGAHNVQDATGAPEDVGIQITRIAPEADKLTVEAEEITGTVPPHPGEPGGGSPEPPPEHYVYIDSTVYNFNLRTQHDALWSPPEEGGTIRCVISSGGLVGSTSTGAPAFTVGSWPANMNIIIQNNGRIQGAGGAGGTGGGGGLGGSGFDDPARNGAAGSVGLNGAAGGTALYTRYAVTLNPTGAIWGGGGGGGGGGSGGGAGALYAIAGGYVTEGGGGGGGPGGGGGGGAGSVGGAGGTPGTPGGGGTYVYNGNPGNAGGTGTAGGATGSANGGAKGTGGIGGFKPSLPSYHGDGGDGGKGGTGGGPGQAGANGDQGVAGDNFAPSQGGTGGARGIRGDGGQAGKAIDGNSYCTKLGSSDVRGGTS